MMMRDWTSFDSAPYDERCVQVGDAESGARAKEECIRHIELIRKKHGPEPKGARLRVKSNPHDFGTYFDISLDLDDDYPDAVAWASTVDADPPATWDDDGTDE